MAAVIAGSTGPPTGRPLGGCKASAPGEGSGSGSEGVFAEVDGGGVPALLPFSGRLVTRLLVLVYTLYSIVRSIPACGIRLNRDERSADQTCYGWTRVVEPMGEPGWPINHFRESLDS
jgi:hypothetical protein